LKIFPAAQIPLIERPHSEPLYFVHVYLPGETLYFSDRNFKFNGHDYEAYLLDIPGTVHTIEQLGGYLNINAQLRFRNARFRSYAKLIDFFIANPITRREMDIFILYIENGVIPGTDLSTKLHKVSFGQFREMKTDTFDAELFSILYALDSKKIFTQINRTLWPDAYPKAIGQYENLWYGSLQNVPCHCVKSGAYSTLSSDLSTQATEAYLTEVDGEIPWPSGPGWLQVGNEKCLYGAKDSTNKKLTALTRGFFSTVAAHHKSGEVIWQLTNMDHKFLAMGRSMKSGSNVRISGTKANLAHYNIQLNEGGKTIINFHYSVRPMNRHSHALKEVFEMRPISASHQDIEAPIYWMGPDTAMIDNNPDTWQRWAYSGVIPNNYTGDMIINFSPYNGDPPDAVYVCVMVFSNFTGLHGEYTRLQSPEVIDIGVTAKTTKRLKLASTTVPTQVRVRGHTNWASSGGLYEINCYEVWLEVERYAVDLSGSGDEVLNPVVTMDGEGFQDDASGTYTGVSYALIENPSDVYRHFLVAILGRSMSEIGTSFATVRAALAARISGGYKFAFILSKIGTKPSDIIKRLNEQSRLQLREDGGKFELDFHTSPVIFGTTDILPPDGTGVSAKSSNPSYPPAMSCDDNGGTIWSASDATFPQWLIIDFGVGITKIVNKLSLTPWIGRVKDFDIRGYDGSTFYVLHAATHANNGNKETYEFFNSTPFRYYYLVIYNSHDGYAATVAEWELFEGWSEFQTPTSVLTIDKTIFVGDPTFEETPSMDIINLIRATYELDYGGEGDRKKFGDYLNQFEIPNPGSIAKYGELSEDISLPAIINPYMAVDVAMYRLAQKKDCFPRVRLICKKQVKKLERNDYFTLNDCPVAAWEGALWRVLEIKKIPNSQRFEISAIKYVAS